MTIGDCIPGSLLAVIEDGRAVCIELGALLGGLHGKKRIGPPTNAIVHTRDMHTHQPLGPRDARTVPASLEVLCVIDLPIQRRAREGINAPPWKRAIRHVEETPGDSTDPMLGRPKQQGSW